MDNREQNKTNKKIMIYSVLLSLPGPIVTGIPAFVSLSSTQIADFIRRTAELIPLIVSLIIYIKLDNKIEVNENDKNKLHKIANKTVTWSMFISAMSMLTLGIMRLFFYNSNGKVGSGLIIAILGLMTNFGFWLKYKKILKEKYDSIIEGQYKVYTAKSSIDLCVVIALTCVFLFTTSHITKYIDSFGCIIVSIYLFYSAFEKRTMIKK